MADVKFSHCLISAHQEAAKDSLAQIASDQREVIQAKIQKYENFLLKLKPDISEISWISPKKVKISIHDEQTFLVRNVIRRVPPIVNIMNCTALNVDLRGEICSLQQKYTNMDNTHINQPRVPSLVFFNCRFSGSNLAGLNLNKSSMQGIKLNRADLSYAKLKDVDLQGADLRDANLKGADLYNTNLIATKINGANLSGAIFRLGLKYSKINLCSNNVEGARITLNLPYFWDDVNLNEQLNHIGSRPRESLLTIIDKIDDKFSKVKLECFHQVIHSLVSFGVDFNRRQFPREAVLVFFTSKQYFMEDEKIDRFVLRVLRSEIPYIENDGGLDKYATPVLNAIMDKIAMSNDERGHDFYMLWNNNFFIALIVRTIYSSDLATRSKSQRLYQTYLTLTPVKYFMQQLEFGNGEGKADWSDKDTNNYILIKKEFAMIINHNNLMDMLSASRIHLCSNWYRFSLYINGDCQPLENVNYDALFIDIFKIFMKSYISSKLQLDFKDYLVRLNLAQYEKKFILALSGKHFSERNKLIKTQDQMNLFALFSDKIEMLENGKNVVLKSNHYREILLVLHLQNCSNKIIAQKLFCCSFMFAKYSSNRFFGTELDSPQTLRNYASALMHKAYELDPNVVGHNYLHWNNCLLGVDQAYDCTYFLSENMLQHARTYFDHILATIVPPSWG